VSFEGRRPWGGIAHLNLSAHQGLRALMEKWLAVWCVAMHNSLTWPSHGWYLCRICGRRFAVPWAEGDEILSVRETRSCSWRMAARRSFGRIAERERETRRIGRTQTMLRH
jgi:hypothetical protein